MYKWYRNYCCLFFINKTVNTVFSCSSSAQTLPAAKVQRSKRKHCEGDWTGFPSLGAVSLLPALPTSCNQNNRPQEPLPMWSGMHGYVWLLVGGKYPPACELGNSHGSPERLRRMWSRETSNSPWRSPSLNISVILTHLPQCASITPNNM